MKEVEAVEVEEVLNLSEQFCWDIERKIAHSFLRLLALVENEFQLCDDQAKLDSIDCKRKKYRNKLEGSDYHASFPIYLINTHLKKYLKTHYDSLLMSSAILLEYSNSIEYGKFNFNSKTRTLTICPSLHYQERPEDFSFSSLDKFKLLIKHILWIKMILYLNELAAEIKNKQKADQHLQDLPRYNLNDETETSKGLSVKSINKSIPKILAFNYNGIKDDKITDLKNALIECNAIPPETTSAQLRAKFNGKEPGKPIEWLAAQGDLATFVKEIIRIMEPEFTSYNQHWNIIVKCFVKKGGESFDPQQLRNSKPTLLEQKFIKAARKIK